VNGEGSWAVSEGDDSRATNLSTTLHLRPSSVITFSGQVAYENLQDNLQYVASPDTTGGPRWVLGRIDQDTWSFTFRANLTLSPELTIQYYGSPFVSAGRYTRLKRATDTLAHAYADRFHEFGGDELQFDSKANFYNVAERGGPSYSFGNPDFSFRQFRSNLVARWEYKPGSALYAVWSQGRTASEPFWQDSLGRNWNRLWQSRADNVFLVKLSYWFSP
jgi:hypothetical protein